MEITEIGKALASPTRVAILGWLDAPETHFTSRREGDLSRHGVCVSLIAEKARISQPTASRHLEILRRAGLIKTTKVRQWTYHRRDRAALAEAARLIRRL